MWDEGARGGRGGGGVVWEEGGRGDGGPVGAHATQSRGEGHRGGGGEPACGATPNQHLVCRLLPRARMRSRG